MTTQPDLQQLLHWHERMWTIRYFEENAINSYRKGLFTGSTHPCIGQEAIAVGGAAALEPTDQVFATYRGHGHAIAKGLDSVAPPPLSPPTRSSPLIVATVTPSRRDWT